MPIASAAKSLYSNILGILVADGTLPSADELVVEHYPELMDVPEGFGPKAERYAFPKDRDITFRQLIGNTSGYMKPGEVPVEARMRYSRPGPLQKMSLTTISPPLSSAPTPAMT